VKMGKRDKYEPEVYRRLEIVRRQFKNSVKEQRKREAVERRRRLWSYLRTYRLVILRYAVFSALAALVIAVIVVLAV
jgi:hypothetical protein